MLDTVKTNIKIVAQVMNNKKTKLYINIYPNIDIDQLYVAM